ncbi:MAG: transposase [candidate division Zixibacteria bacterium]|nr:transposase [candidate division Zixibacteria bacterium]
MNGKISLNSYGKIVHEFWDKIPDHFAKAEVDTFSVMPNHIHGTIMITEECRGGVTPPKSRDEETSPLQKRSLGQIVAYFKYQTTRSINQNRKTPGIPVWQRNYYDHIVRNEKELNQVLKYIIENPLKWELDKENPNNL